jgi:serine protease Do
VLAEEYGDDLEALLDSHFQSVAEACTPEGRYAYGDAIYQGLFNFFTDCGGTDTRFIVVAAQPEDGSFTILLTVQVVSQADLNAADRILDSFEVVGDLP